jgi:hypothetical protein
MANPTSTSATAYRGINPPGVPKQYAAWLGLRFRTDEDQDENDDDLEK